MNILKTKKTTLFFLQCVSILVSILIAISVFPINIVNASGDEIEVWDGTKASSFAGGEGTKEKPWLIENASQLYKVIAEYCSKDNSFGKYFKITKDIYINDVTDGTPVQNLAGKRNWLEELGKSITAPTTSNRLFFYGTLDGDNHTIYGLYAKATTALSLGLFPAISNGATVQNLSFDNVFLTGGNGSGGAVAGYANWGGLSASSYPASIKNCSVVNATIGENKNLLNASGFVGNMSDCTITFTNCRLYNGNFSATNVGGVVGSAYAASAKPTVVNSYFIGYFPVTVSINKLSYTNVYTDITPADGVYNTGTTVLTSEQMKGENAKQYMSGFDFERTWKTVENDYPETFVYVKPDYIWDGSTAEEFAGGTGTADDPFLIANGAQLYKMVAEYSNAAIAKGSVNNATYFKLTADIYLNDVKSTDLDNPTLESWNSLGFEKWYSPTNENSGFCGELNGAGHTVYGLFGSGAYSGLIPLATDGAKVYDLNLKNSYTNGTHTAGGIIGYVPGHYTLKSISISGCSVDNTVIYADQYRAGGIVGGIGYIKVKVTNCSTTDSKITAASTEYPGRASGMIGYAVDNDVKHEVTNCFTDDTVHPVCIATDKYNFDRIDDKVIYTNVYTAATKNFDADEGVTYLTTEQMNGENAKQNMSGFDFGRIWKAVENDYPQYTIYIKPSYVWDGTKAEEFAGGTGTSEAPFLIENGAQLYKMVVDYSNASSGSDAENKKTYFKITKDIYLNDVKTDDIKNPNLGSWASIFTPWYSVSGVGKGFCGELDGGNHTIYGLFGNGSYVGLFPIITDDAKISNLYLKDSFINSSSEKGSAGAIVGYAGEHHTRKGVTVKGCTVDNSVVISASQKASGIIGGFGQIDVAVADCSVLRTKITSTNSTNPNLASAFISSGWGDDKSRTVTNCFTDSYVHPVTASTVKEDIDTLTAKIKYTNVYTSSSKNFDISGIIYLTDEQMKGENVKQYMPGLDFVRSWKVVDDDYPTHIIYVRPSDIWDGKKADSFAGGTGTANDPFLIENGGQLYKMVVDYSNASAKSGTENTKTYFKLIKDIHLNDVTDEDLKKTSAESWAAKFNTWYSVSGVGKGFCGELDGDTHTVYGLFTTGSYVGLFPVITDDAKISNLYLKDSFINGSSENGSAGAIVGYAGEHHTRKGVTVKGCTVDNSVVISASQKASGIIGGFGQIDVAVADCSVLRTKITSTNSTNPNLASAFISSGWGDDKSRTVTNCFTDSYAHPVTASTVKEDIDTLTAKIKYTNVYTSSSKNFDISGIIYLTDEQMKGENAKQYMPELDFVRSWKTVAGDYPTHIIYTKPDYVWDGKKAESFAGGKGTETDPYLIENGGQLYKMVVDYSDASTGKDAQNTKTYFKLIDDIHLNDVTDDDLKNPSAESWAAKFNTWYSVSGIGKGFCGELDGDTHTVYGLFTTGSYVGLFPVITDGAKISNLYLKNSFVNGSSEKGSAGAIVGYVGEHYKLQGVSVTGSTVENSVVKSASQKAGGIIGGFGELAIAVADCSVIKTKVVSTNEENPNLASAFIGSGWGNKTRTVTNCFTDSYTHPVTASKKQADVDTLTAKIKYTNVYTSSSKNFDISGIIYLTDEQMKGENAKKYMSALDFVRSWKTVAGDYPTHIIYTSPTDIWDGKKADSFAGGKGTESDPYLIENGSQLYKMVVDYSNSATGSGAENSKTYFKLTKDIKLNDINDTDIANAVAESWSTKFNTWYSVSGIGKGFSGDFDGNGHTIYGLFSTGSFAGLIPVLTDGGKVSNLYLKNSFVNSSSSKGSAGAIVGYAGEHYKLKGVTVTGCTVENSLVKTASQKAGGIVGGFGEVKISVADCSVIRTKVVSTNEENPNLASAFIGSGWGSVKKSVTNCFTDSYAHPVTASKNKADVDALTAKIKYTNVYTAAAKNFDIDGIVYLTENQMKGENAKQYMSGLDYVRSWKIVEGDYPTHIIYVRPKGIWDGKKAESFAGGSGTAYDPYLIENGGQLYKMVADYSNAVTSKGSSNVTTYFKLTKDIYLNDINANDLKNPSAEAWDTKFNTWYTLSGTGKGFCGDLNGDGYTVYGLFANGGFAGLIPILTDGGNVHNLNLENSFVNGTATGGSTGGIVGYVGGHYTLSPVSVTYCTVDNTVVKGASKRVAGIIGGFEQLKITLSDCSVTRTQLASTSTDNSNLVAAFIGNGWGVKGHTISNSFSDNSMHPVVVSTKQEEIDVVLSTTTYTNVYTSAKKTVDVEGVTYLGSDSKLKGTEVSKVLKGLDFKYDWSAVEDDYPVIKKDAGEWLFDKSKPGEIWSGKIAKVYASGSGTKEDPYVIQTGGQLALLANDALNGRTVGKYYKLTEDIILNNTSSENWQDKANEWYTGKWAQAFRGYLDGGYHTISGLYLNKNKDNYTGTDYYGGLFACIGKGAVIEKLGIVNSSLTFTDAVSQRYIGAFAGFVDQYDSSTNKALPEEYPIIRECFADSTVYLEANSCGGFIGCTTRPIRVENSFFTGTVKDTGRGLFGYSKMGYTVDEVLVKNFYAADSKFAVLSNSSYDNVNCENCYSSSAQDKAGLTRLFIDKMLGKEAKENMTGFDFDKMWVVRGDNETPGLKGFKANSYSNVMSPEDIVVSFETNCDLVVESITGKAYSKLTLPEISRDGYIFEGWYSFPELDVPFKYDYFPTFDTILYAKWTLDGYVQDFEQYEDTVYDYHEGVEYYRPTVEGYSAKYVHGGAKSMHRLGGTDEYMDFLLFYREELEIGKTYKMIFYTTTDQDSATADLSLVHLEWPDVYSANKGVSPIGNIEKIENGKWVEHTYTFVAESKWIAIRTVGDSSLYFDDFTLYRTDGDADVIDVGGSKTVNTMLIIIIAAIVAVLAVGFVITFTLIRKRTK